MKISVLSLFLEHCSVIFEYVMLSDYRIRQGNQAVLQSIINGQNFFESWLTMILQNNPGFKAGSSTQKCFLAWQTWDLQRIMIYGFKQFAEDFFVKYGNSFFISPKHFNGSAIET